MALRTWRTSDTELTTTPNSNHCSTSASAGGGANMGQQLSLLAAPK